jgi:hypothetical protein
MTIGGQGGNGRILEKKTHSRFHPLSAKNRTGALLGD